MVGKAWYQKRGVSGYTASAVRKREVEAGAQLIFYILFSPCPQPRNKALFRTAPPIILPNLERLL